MLNTLDDVLDPLCCRKVETARRAEAGTRGGDAGLCLRAPQEEDLPRPRGLRQPLGRYHTGVVRPGGLFLIEHQLNSIPQPLHTMVLERTRVLGVWQC